MSAIDVISSAPRLERQTLGNQVYAHIRQLLIAGRLAPGDKLSLRQIADVMGVSMMPVREAVSRLVADEAVEVTPNRALRVPMMSRRQFEELAIIRAEIEGFAAARVAQVRGGTHLAAIKASERRFRELARAASPDLADVVEANQAFHFAV
jgi:DNA-binding GntR family transcriptional regulator